MHTVCLPFFQYFNLNPVIISLSSFSWSKTQNLTSVENSIDFDRCSNCQQRYKQPEYINLNNGRAYQRLDRSKLVSGAVPVNVMLCSSPTLQAQGADISYSCANIFIPPAHLCAP